MLSRIIGAAAVAYSLIALVYGRADYAAIGPIEFDTSWLETIIPALAAIAYPLLSRYVPGWPLISRALSRVMPQPTGNMSDAVRHLLELLRAINALEEAAALQTNSAISDQCAEIRHELLTQLKSAGSAG